MGRIKRPKRILTAAGLSVYPGQGLGIGELGRIALVHRHEHASFGSLHEVRSRFQPFIAAIQTQ